MKMGKLVVTILIAVLLGGAALYAVGSQLVPATGTAGTNTKGKINTAFQ
jgi:hypothetical protein